MKKNISNTIITTIVISLLLGTITFSTYRLIKKKDSVKKGDIVYYLNTDNTIKYATLVRDNVIKQYIYYTKETKISDAQKDTKVSQVFDVDSYSNITLMQRFNEKTQEITEYYIYYSGTRFNSEYDKKEKYIFYIDDYGKLIRSIEFEKDTHRIIKYVEYYDNTIYGKEHVKKIHKEYILDADGYIEYMVEKEIITGKELKKYLYQSQTKYDTRTHNHENKVTEIIDL